MAEEDKKRYGQTSNKHKQRAHGETKRTTLLRAVCMLGSCAHLRPMLSPLCAENEMADYKARGGGAGDEPAKKARDTQTRSSCAACIIPDTRPIVKTPPALRRRECEADFRRCCCVCVRAEGQEARREGQSRTCTITLRHARTALHECEAHCVVVCGPCQKAASESEGEEEEDEEEED